jgi:DNA repair exonuclease SbcCD ATPase subunit
MIDDKVMKDAARMLESAARKLKRITSKFRGIPRQRLLSEAKTCINAALARLPEERVGFQYHEFEGEGATCSVCGGSHPEE